MSIPYFNGFVWNDLTREERFYCFELYSHARKDPNDFASWITNFARLPGSFQGEWDLGLEVCFYRDYLWHQGKPIHGSEFSPKRTFDLCLFGPRDIIIIEAKVFQQFESDQNESFARDAKQIDQLLSPYKVNVWLLALASSKYFESVRNLSTGNSLEPFHGQISWADAYHKFGDKILKQADDLYGSNTRKLHGFAA